MTLATLQSALGTVQALPEFTQLASDFLQFALTTPLATVTSPSHPPYFFFIHQAGQISRPLNGSLFESDPGRYASLVGRAMQLLDVARSHRENAKAVALQNQLDWRDLDAFVYTTAESRLHR